MTLSAEGRHVRGTPLSARLALVILLLVAVFMVAFAFFLRHFIRDTVNDQLKETALQTARAAAQADVEAWGEYFDTPYQGLTYEEINEIRLSFPNREVYEQRFLTLEQKAQREWNNARFKRLMGEDSKVLAARLLTPDRQRFIAATHDSMSFVPFGNRYARGAGVVEEGRLKIGPDKWRAVRGEYPVVDSDGNIVGRFGVYILASAIDVIADDFMIKVAYAAGLFILLGGVVAFVMGRGITRPLWRLQQDMRIVAAGDLQHHTLPHSNDEIGELARTFNTMTRSLEEAAEMERKAAASQHQLSVASEVTASLFPAELPIIPGYDIAGHHESPEELSGEYYDVLEMEGGRWGLLVADASGTGVPAAMVMVMARSLVTAVAQDEVEPDVVLRKVNALMSGDLRRGMYVSMMLAVLDPETGHLRVANAGHPPLLVYRAASKKMGALHSEGIALGFDEGPVFDRTLKVAEQELHPGDRIIFRTPGVAGMIGADGSELGEKRFLGLVMHDAHLSAGAFARHTAGVLAKYRGDEPLSAEVTLLTLGRHSEDKATS